MATQTLEFNAATGLTISCKLFALESDVVVATATATEKTNDKNRYSVVYTDIPAGTYRLNGFVSSIGGFVNEQYILTLSTNTFHPSTGVAASPQEIAAELEREIGPLYKLYRKFDGIDKIIKWLRK
jgi:hypothetical protein